MEMKEENLISFPLVSVLMTAYNRQEYISEAIESVLNSDYKNFELIICDDKSTDNTLKIAQEYSLKDQRVQVYVNEINLGQFPNRNRALSLAKGKYVKYLDSDDMFYNFSLGYCVNMMENNPGADWGMLSFKKEDEGVLYSSNEIIRRHFFGNPILSIGPDGTIYKKDFFLKLGGYSQMYGPANDVYTNILAASRGNLILMTKDFFYYRLHQDQELNNHYGYLHNNYNLLKDIFFIIKENFTQEELTLLENKNKRRFIVNISKYFFTTLNFSKTKSAINKAGFNVRDAYQGIFH